MTDKDQDLSELAKFMRAWAEDKTAFKKKALVTLKQEAERLEDILVQPYAKHRVAEGSKILQEYLDRIEIIEEKIIKEAKGDCPYAFFIPSYEQCQFLNAWSPEFDPVMAPNGFRTIADFGSVRGGKTCENILNIGYWIFPNDKDYPCFEPMKDHFGREYQLKRRPNWDYWQKTGRMHYEDDTPPKPDAKIWLGCPDDSSWQNKIDPEMRKWYPQKFISRKGNDVQWLTSMRRITTKWDGVITGKVYQSDVSAYSGTELFLTAFDEGPPRLIIDECRLRSTMITWSYTPREAANTQDRAKVAYDAYMGKFKLLEPVKFLFTQMKDLPDHILSKEKRDQRIAIAESMGDSGRATIGGGFIFSSPAVFSHFNRERNILPVDGDMIVNAINGTLDPVEIQKYPWLDKFRDANIVRGFDEGFATDSACAWVALLKSGEWVMFKEFSESYNSITERVEKIIGMSGNEIKEINRNTRTANDEEIEALREYYQIDSDRERITGAKPRRFREIYKKMKILKTFADSKLFKVNPETPMENWGSTYTRAGMAIDKADNAQPNARCDYLNTMLRVDSSRRHLNPTQNLQEDGAGAAFYVTRDCMVMIERFENYLWETVSSGARIGEFTGKPERKDDHLIDGACYTVLSKLRWKDQRERLDRRNQITNMLCGTR